MSIGNPIIRGRGIAAAIRRPRQQWRSSMKRLPGSFSENEDPIGKHFGRAESDAEPRIRNGGRRQRCPLFDLQDRPAGRPRSTFFRKRSTTITREPILGIGLAFLHDIVIVTRPGAQPVLWRRSAKPWLRWIPICRSFRFAL